MRLLGSLKSYIKDTCALNPTPTKNEFLMNFNKFEFYIYNNTNESIKWNTNISYILNDIKRRKL